MASIFRVWWANIQLCWSCSVELITAQTMICFNYFSFQMPAWGLSFWPDFKRQFYCTGVLISCHKLLDDLMMMMVCSVWRTDDKMITQVPSVIKNSVSDPVHLSSPKHDQTDGQASPSPPPSLLHVPATNESEIRKSPSTERKKKIGLSKLLHSTKQKAP